VTSIPDTPPVENLIAVLRQALEPGLLGPAGKVGSRCFVTAGNAWLVRGSTTWTPRPHLVILLRITRGEAAGHPRRDCKDPPAPEAVAGAAGAYLFFPAPRRVRCRPRANSSASSGFLAASLL